MQLLVKQIVRIALVAHDEDDGYGKERLVNVCFRDPFSLCPYLSHCMLSLASEFCAERPKECALLSEEVLTWGRMHVLREIEVEVTAPTNSDQIGWKSNDARQLLVDDLKDETLREQLTNAAAHAGFKCIILGLLFYLEYLF